jgi:hypothetical protein
VAWQRGVASAGPYAGTFIEASTSKSPTIKQSKGRPGREAHLRRMSVPYLRTKTASCVLNGVHGFRWFTVCAPAGWDPSREEWEVIYREVRRRQRAYRDSDMG